MYHNAKMDMIKLPCVQTLIVALVLLIAGCAPAHYMVTTPTPESNQLGNKLLVLHNDARRDALHCGASRDSAVALIWSDQLASAAFRHATDMASKDFLGHRGSDRSSSKKRIEDSGFVWSKYGENIAHGNRMPEVIVAKWLQYERHCRNIMDPDFTAMGAAMVDGYWTAVFARQ